MQRHGNRPLEVTKSPKINDEVSVFRIRNPAAFELPELADLVTAAFDHPGTPVPAATALPELQRLVPTDHVGVFVGREDGYRALAVVGIPVSPLVPDVSIYHFYNRGTTALRRAMGDAIREFAASHGYASLSSINRVGRDSAYLRLLEPDLGRGQPLGTAFRFRFDEETG